MTPKRPYFLRALHEWIVDNGLTPHLMVYADMPGVVVPEQYIRDGKIVLNISPVAVANLSLGKAWVTFDARFSGVSRNIRLPMQAIEAIYALENGHGMVFEEEDFEDQGDDAPTPTPSGSKRPGLKVVK